MRGLKFIVVVLTLALFGGTMVWAQTPPATENAVAKAAADDITKEKYKGGFVFGTDDGKFSLKLFSAVQFRYTYMPMDDDIKGNTEDYSNFYMRRARLWWQGHAYDPRFTYYFHLQLEPQGAVNLHDAWIQYDFAKMLKLGAGRNKIGYGLEFLHSGFGLNFIDRSIMYGETDIDAGGGYQKWPGSNGGFGISTYNANTGYPTGGLHLFRSQGIQLSGLSDDKGGNAFEYQIGIWNGRDKRGRSNGDSDHLYVARVGWHPFGFQDWLFQGDTQQTDKFKLSMWAAAYTDSEVHNKDAAGTAVAAYDATDTGFNVSMMMVYKGLSAEAEYGEDSYEMERDGLSRDSYDRNAYRVQVGFFVVPKKVEIVARYSQVERLEDATPEAVAESGLGFVDVWNDDTDAYQKTIEDTLTELTAGVNFYLHRGHQHKLFFDISQLSRSFQAYNGFAPDDQDDIRFRSMLQFKF